MLNDDDLLPFVLAGRTRCNDSASHAALDFPFHPGNNNTDHDYRSRHSDMLYKYI